MSVRHDFWAADGDVLTDIFGSYNFGYTDYECMPKQCTITEITDDLTDFDIEMEEKDINVDELAKAFDYLVEDWKLKMEVIIGDGLKKLRKAQKERKLMMKYLPGDKKVQAAKQSIAKDWKIDYQKAFGTTHKKLEKLAADKAKEVDQVVDTDSKKPGQLNKNKKQVININLKASPESAYGNLRNLIQELDKMVHSVQGESPLLHSIPIYSKEARGQVLPAYSNYWLELQKTIIDRNEQRQSFIDVLEDFKIKFSQQEQKLTCLKKGSKSRVEESNAVNAKKRMLERKLNKKSSSSVDHFLKSYKNKNGQEHFLVVKKKMNDNGLEMEDIFQDWKPNLVDIFEQRRLAALAARKNRKRKLSNRALRKELVKEIEAEENSKPKSYADMLKKNLKPPMEDIFEAWRDYLTELDDILNNDSRTSFSKDESAEEILESAQSFQKTLLYCGQPTVKSATLKNLFDAETIFASWRHNLTIPDQTFEQVSTLVNNKNKPESYFSAWKVNLKEEQDLDFESWFQEWNHNLDIDVDVDCGYKLAKSDSKMLKNKPRNQRKSKKNNKH